MEDDKSCQCLLPPKYKPRRVSAVRDFPKGLKGFSDYVDSKSTSGQSCGLQDKYLKETGPRAVLSCHDTLLPKGDSTVDFGEGVLDLGLKKQCGVAVAVEEIIHNNPKGLKRFSEDGDPKTKVDESCGSKTAKEFKKSVEESDPKVKGGEACGSKNEPSKPMELHVGSIDNERELDFDKGVLQLGTKQQCVNGDENRVNGLKKNPLCQKVGAIWNSVNLIVDGVKSWREEQHVGSEQELDHFSGLQKQCSYDNGNVLGSKESTKCQNIGTSVNSCDLLGNHPRKFPNRRKVSAIRDFPPALVRLIPLSPRQMNTKMSDGTTNNISAIGQGYKKSENVGECLETGVENEKDLDILKTDDFSYSIANERKESFFDLGKELLIDKEASADHLGVVERGYSDINVETGVGNRFLINDESCLDIKNRGFHNPSGHDSPSVKDFEESTYQLDAPDDKLSLAPADVDVFFSEDCHNGFLFEDYGEPSESNSQSVQRDVSEEILKTSDDIGTMDGGIRAIVGSGGDEQRLHLNDIRNEVSTTKKFSIPGKGKEDVSSLFIPQKKPLCKKTHGFSQQRYPSVGDSIWKNKAPNYRMGEVQAHKTVQREGGGSRVGKVKYMPHKEALKALEKRNNFLSVKNYKKAPTGRVSGEVTARVVVQGLMAAKRCPWRHSRK